jgi:succinate dehydrogenase / fumarate reductase cytochrome b subunit
VPSKRPVDLNLLGFKFPITAIASVLHRISGCFLFLMLPCVLWLWSLSLQSPCGFAESKAFLMHPISRLILLAVLFALYYHLAAGIRHMVMDTGLGEDLNIAKRSARGVMVLAILLTALSAVWIGWH